MTLDDQGPDWDTRRPRYTWTPPVWLQVILVIGFLAALCVLSAG